MKITFLVLFRMNRKKFFKKQITQNPGFNLHLSRHCQPWRDMTRIRSVGAHTVQVAPTPPTSHPRESQRAALCQILMRTVGSRGNIES